MEELICSIVYLVAGVVSTYWVEKILVDQGMGNELGLALGFGDRIKSIILWPIFTGPYLIDFIVIFLREMAQMLEGDDQQQT